MIVTLENQEEYLQIFGRYSKHYEHNKLRRKRFPKDQGVIGRAFVNGEYDEVFFPDNLKGYALCRFDPEDENPERVC